MYDHVYTIPVVLYTILYYQHQHDSGHDLTRSCDQDAPSILIGTDTTLLYYQYQVTLRGSGLLGRAST